MKNIKTMCAFLVAVFGVDVSALQINTPEAQDIIHGYIACSRSATSFDGLLSWSVYQEDDKLILILSCDGVEMNVLEITFDQESNMFTASSDNEDVRKQLVKANFSFDVPSTELAVPPIDLKTKKRTVKFPGVEIKNAQTTEEFLTALSDSVGFYFPEWWKQVKNFEKVV
ncbi:MAG: hypothetical protein LBB21_05235 [Holosporaceae bacterium]|nr:hypothetical protein [Holosporaceae bacterium]